MLFVGVETDNGEFLFYKVKLELLHLMKKGKEIMQL